MTTNEKPPQVQQLDIAAARAVITEFEKIWWKKIDIPGVGEFLNRAPTGWGQALDLCEGLMAENERLRMVPLDLAKNLKANAQGELVPIEHDKPFSYTTGQFIDDRELLLAERDEAIADLAEAKAALAWYGDEANWLGYTDIMTGGRFFSQPPVHTDLGARAAAALAKMEGK